MAPACARSSPPVAVGGTCLALAPVPDARAAAVRVQPPTPWPRCSTRCSTAVATSSSPAPPRRARRRCCAACSRRTRPGERIVTLEDTAELHPAVDHLVRLEARPASADGAAAVTLERAAAHGAAPAPRPPRGRRGARRRGGRARAGAEHRPRRVDVDVPRQQRPRRPAPARDARRADGAGVAARPRSATTSPGASTSSCTSSAPPDGARRIVEVAEVVEASATAAMPELRRPGERRSGARRARRGRGDDRRWR